MVHFPQLVTHGQLSWKELMLLLTDPQVLGSLTLCQNARVLSLTVTQHLGILPSPILTRRVGEVQ